MQINLSSTHVRGASEEALHCRLQHAQSVVLLPPHAIMNPPMPKCAAVQTRFLAISQVEYSGISSWKKHVCATGRAPSPPARWLSLNWFVQWSPYVVCTYAYIYIYVHMNMYLDFPCHILRNFHIFAREKNNGMHLIANGHLSYKIMSRPVRSSSMCVCVCGVV